MHSIALFGGTFDPIHNGHIKTSINIQKYFNFDSYRFLPCKTPAIKPPTIANTEQRITMLELAIKKLELFQIDLREIERTSPSYMVETLQSLRREHKESSITLIIGYDAFLSLPKWHQWEKLIEFAHLLIINRGLYNNEVTPSPLSALLKKHQVSEKEPLINYKAGAIYEFNAGNYPISSTEIRSLLKEQQNVSSLLPKEVYNYIKLQGLYL